MSDDAIPEAMAVFPLPGLVFLPGQRLPLHIFEPRYRVMVRDALAGKGWLAVACALGPDGEEPAVFSPMATAGRIHAHQQLPDGRYNILVEGIARARLLEIPAATPYRVTGGRRSSESRSGSTRSPRCATWWPGGTAHGCVPTSRP
jgi:Lon protease-like protein